MIQLLRINITMPYKPRSNRRRPKQPRYPQSSGYLDTAAKALTVAYAVRKLINVEFKMANTGLTVDPSSSGVVQNLTSISQGDTLAARDGNKIRAKRIEISGLVTMHASATQSHLRLMLVRDNNGSTTQPAITDLFSTVAVFSQNRPKLGDPQNNSRFSILWDKFIIVDASYRQVAPFSMSLTLDHHIYYSGTSGTDEGKGNLYLFMASNEATNDPIVNAGSNFTFIDN